jgi:CRISPR-associated protein Cas1
MGAGRVDADSADTVEGRHAHRRVDKRARQRRLRRVARGPRLVPAKRRRRTRTEPRIHVHSLELSSQALGLVARLDLAEFDGPRAVPVDYKRGRRPHVARGAYEPERVQLCAQALLLERARLRVARRRAVLRRLARAGEGVLRRRAASPPRARPRPACGWWPAGGQSPPPLENSPKCPRCSLAPICLPDELHYLRTQSTPPRPLAVGGTVALPMYVQSRGAKVAKSGEVLEVSVDDAKVASARLVDVSQLVLQGGVYLTTPALHELMARGIPVSWLSHGGWFLGHTIGLGHKNVELRAAQYRASFDASHCLRLARDLVVAKIRNQRTQLRRNWKAGAGEVADAGMPEALLTQFRQDIDAAQRAHDLQQLLGVEGSAAARYFAHFGRMLSPPAPGAPDAGLWTCDFERRTRRPPTDPVNALLSYGYALLARSVAVTLTAVGFDAMRGYFHQPRYGRPALALDVMEPLRPLLADSVVLTVINNGEIGAADFVRAAGAVNLNERGRRAFIAAFERRLGQEVTHPVFGYAAQYRQIVELQCRLLARHLLGEIDTYPNFTTR